MDIRQYNERTYAISRSIGISSSSPHKAFCCCGGDISSRAFPSRGESLEIVPDPSLGELCTPLPDPVPPGRGEGPDGGVGRCVVRGDPIRVGLSRGLRTSSACSISSRIEMRIVAQRSVSRRQTFWFSWRQNNVQSKSGRGKSERYSRQQPAPRPKCSGGLWLL